MNDIRVRKLVMSALFTALICVATMVIRIPSPTGGYVNAGDAVIILGAFLLGPVYGALAAGLGSALADILSGYVIYAIGTLIIKSLMGLCAAAIFKKLTTAQLAAAAISGIAAETIMILGYFLYSGVFLGFGLGAAADIPGNCVQGAFGVIAGTALYLSIDKTPSVKDLFE